MLDSIALGYKGSRADYPVRRKAFESKMPFSGIDWDQTTDTIDLSKSNVALDCHRFLQDLGKQLVVRLHSNKKP